MVIKFLHELKFYLETKEAASDVVVETPKPVDEATLFEWERTNDCQLPAEFRNFYLTTNGISLLWYGLHSDAKLLIGHIHLNGIRALKQVSLTIKSEADSTCDPDMDVFAHELMEPLGKSEEKKLFLMEQYSHSCIILALGSIYSGIYYVDRDASFHRICDTLSQYIRLAVVHLGLLGWQTWYTTCGPRSEFLQYAALYTPERLSLNSKGGRHWLEDDACTQSNPVIHSQKLQSIECSVSERSTQLPRNSGRATSANRGRSVDSARAKRSTEPSNYLRRSRF